MLCGVEVLRGVAAVLSVAALYSVVGTTTTTTLGGAGGGRNVTERHVQGRWTVAELEGGHFGSLVSGDIDMDPCKAEGYVGDIAVPNTQYDLEWKMQNANKTYREVLEKYKKEILNEGLQVEEEGLVGLHREKHPYDETRSLEKDVDDRLQSTLIDALPHRRRRQRKKDPSLQAPSRPQLG